MDAHFAVSLQIKHLRHAPARRMAGSAQKWQEGVDVALTSAVELVKPRGLTGRLRRVGKQLNSRKSQQKIRSKGSWRGKREAHDEPCHHTLVA